MCRSHFCAAGTREGAEAANPAWMGCFPGRVQPPVKPAGRLPPAPGNVNWGRRASHGRRRALPTGVAHSPRAGTAVAGSTWCRFPKAKGHHADGQAILHPRSPPDGSAECKEKANFRGDEVSKGFEHNLIRKKQFFFS